MAADRASQYYHITTAGTYQIKTGRGRLRRIVINTPVANDTVKIIDGTSGTTANIATITEGASVSGPVEIDYNVIFMNGLRIITDGNDDITVVFE